MFRFLFLILFFFSHIFSSPLILENRDSELIITKNINIYIDKTNNLSIEDILKDEIIFQKIPAGIINLGFRNDTIWVKFSLTQNFKDNLEKILLISNHSINYLNFYQVENFSQEIIQSFEVGNKKYFNYRPIEYREFAFPFFMEKNENYEIYLKIKSLGSISIPIYLYDYPRFFISKNREETLHGAFYGIMLCLAVYSIFLYLNSKDFSYVYFSLYISTYAILQSIGHGHANQYLWPNNSEINNSIFIFSIGINIITSSLFSGNFLKLKVYSPIFYKFFKIMVLLTILLLFSFLFIDIVYLRAIFLIQSMILSLSIIIASSRAWVRGFKPARYFFLSWILFFLGINITILKFLGFLQESFITEYGIQIGALIQALFLAVSLADKINVVKKESQQATIRTLQFQESAKNELERKVKKRTEELNKYVNTLKKDLQMANFIQSSILPKDTLFLQGFNIHSKYIPLDKVGGDFYDIFEFSKHKIRIFISDATGHGVQAALITMSIKSEYDSLKSIILQPSELLEELHSRFKEVYKGIKVYFSAVVIDLDILNNKATYCSAGHPDQFLIRDGKIMELKRTTKLMGLSVHSEFFDKEIDYFPSDKLLLFTDGIYEEFNSKKEQYGEARMREKIINNKDKPIPLIISEILSSLEEFLDNKTIQDDITIIGVECP